MFLAVYGRLPSEFTPEVAIGLAENIPHVEARQALTLSKAIAVAFGDEVAVGQVYGQAFGQRVASHAVAKVMHQKAVASCR